MEFFKGQRWLSETEPELGLGMVLSVDNRTLQLLFPTTDEVRTYTRDNPPLKRAKFLEGDSIETYEGQKLTVESIEEKDGLYFYVASGTEIPEAYLADSINMSMADRRLMNGRVDPSEIFDLRYDTLTHQCRIHKHPGYGYLGARIDLIPHQLYIAREVASRSIPRVMLADEVGLGKTIEACLILHRLYVRGLCGKVMIIVPEALIHQWFIELLRRFNMNFSIFNEERCNSMQQVNKDANPFDEEHLILTNLRFLMDNDKRLKEALEINWGLLIIDEVHHLQWTELEASAEYQAIEALSSKSKGLLLLTGTPEQFGAEGHFARLRLLDPARFNSLASYQEETQSYHETAERIQILIDKKILTDTDEKKIIPLIDGMKELEEQFKKFKSQDKIQIETAREFLINDLLDRYGTGRVVFRNTRAAIKGFPKRYAHGIPLKSKKDDSINWKEIANHEIAFELNEREHLKHHGNAAKDPRID
ncbi:MAG: SNF2-related protein, partial [Verrucomicrobiota bacterium]